MITAQALIGKFRQALDDHWGYIWGMSGGIWTQRDQDAATREQTVNYGQQWVGHHVADCSGLFAWAFKKLGGYMYHGSNTIWDKYCTDRGKITNGHKQDGTALRPGTAVFVDHEGDKSHIGLYIGGGDVIEAAGTKQGVVMSKVTDSKWTHWGELKGVNYDADSSGSEIPVSKAHPTLKWGSKGPDVVLAQEELIRGGYDVGPKGADGIFGNKTLEAVKAFQRDSGLVADGVIGPKTWEALTAQATLPKKTYRAVISGLTKDQATELLKRYPTADLKEE